MCEEANYFKTLEMKQNAKSIILMEEPLILSYFS